MNISNYSNLLELDWSQLLLELKKFAKQMRDDLVKAIQVLTDSDNKMSYTQNPALRFGPKSFDCSGLVSSSYQNVGLKLPNITVKGIVESSLFKEIQEDEAIPGDLVIHLPSDHKLIRSNHVGVFTGFDE